MQKITTHTHRRDDLPDDDRAYYSAVEVAELLRLDVSTVYAGLRAKEIPGRKNGPRWAIAKCCFHAWLDDLPEATVADVARLLTEQDIAELSPELQAEVRRLRSGQPEEDHHT